jgi:hypothetical protein
MTATALELDAILDALEARLAARPVEPLVNLAGEHVSGRAASGRVQVSPGQTIASSWGNLVWDQSVNTFASIADRTTQWPAAHDGALCWTIAENTLWLYRAGWVAMVGPGQAPLASGAALASSVDAQGTVWVAKGGVNARDVLHARWYRAAAWVVAQANPLTLDTASRDPYGLWVPGSSAFVAPIAGIYLVGYSAIVSVAAGAYIQNIINLNGANRMMAQQYFGAAGYSGPQCRDALLCNAGDAITFVTLSASTSSAGSVGTENTNAFIDYLGTG